jgi:hypothetical protein
VKVILFDHREFVVSKDEGEKLTRSLAKGTDGFITLNGAFIKKTAIAYVMQGGVTEADLPKPNDPSRRIKSDNRSEDEQYQSARKASDIARAKLKKVAR